MRVLEAGGARRPAALRALLAGLGEERKQVAGEAHGEGRAEAGREGREGTGEPPCENVPGDEADGRCRDVVAAVDEGADRLGERRGNERSGRGGSDERGNEVL